MRVKTIILPSLLGLALMPTIGAAKELTPQEELGKLIFKDATLSLNGDQSCATCHAPEVGWTGPDPNINAHGAVYEGSDPGKFGDRKPPSAAYATQSPVLHFVLEKPKNNNKVSALFIGGNFWDGRATGKRLFSPAAEQALGPFLNPLEQALLSAADVISRICISSYSSQFTEVCGTNACDTTVPENVSTAYDCVGLSIAAYEGSPEVNQFSSKYDAFLKGQVDLTKQEKQGLNLFKSKGKCAACHVLDPGPNGSLPLLTDYTYDNLGVPKNPKNPFYNADPQFNPLGAAWIDLGLGDFLRTQMMQPEWVAFAPQNFGKQKVPTLRNVDLRPTLAFVKAYSHNGYFKSLKGIVHFYNTRDAKPVCPEGDPDNPLDDYTEAQALDANCWPKPEVAANVNTKELGNLHLTSDQEDAIVAFLTTLSDGYTP